MAPAARSAQRSKRLQLLDDPDRADLYDRPVFTDADRVIGFTLSDAEASALPRSADDLVHAFLILQLGYFKAKQRFFPLRLPELQDDLRWILQDLASPLAPTDLRLPNARTIHQQRQQILEYHHYRYAHADERAALFQVASLAARISPKPPYLVRMIIEHCATERIILPAYTTLQEPIIGKAITAEEDRLIDLLEQHMTGADQDQLEALFERTEGRYRLTRVGRAPKNFRHAELRHERTRAIDLRPGYQLAARLLAPLALSREALTYYASLVGFYGATRLKDLGTWMVYVYVLSFLHQRYHQMHDHLIGGLLQAVKRYRDTATEAASERASTYRVALTQDLARAGQVLQLFTANHAPDATTLFADVQAQAFALLEPDRLARTATFLATGAGCDETAFFWQHIDTLARHFKGRLRPLLLGIDLAASRAHAPLLEAVTFLQVQFARRSRRALTQIDPQTIPTRCIPVHLKRYLYTRDSSGVTQLLVDRYEFLVYQQVRAALESGDLVCPQSLRYRSLEDDLIPLAEWQANKDALIAATTFPILQQPITDHLAELKRTLEARLAAVNSRIVAGNHPTIKVTQHGTTRKWTLQTPKSRETANHALFQRLPQVSINDVLAFVHERCHFMDAFAHVLGRGHHARRDDQVLRACLIAWGTNLGLGRMGEISDITTRTLARASENYVRLETARSANTYLVNAMAQMPLFRRYDIDGVIHSSSDGQKFETDRETFNAQHSPKYFNHGKGVVAVSLVANHLIPNTDLRSAHDHEGQSVLDMIYNNPTDVHPEIHSTDTHGTNQVNFALLKVFGHTFAPRYADMQDKMRTGLYGFQHPSEYGEDVLFRPVRKLNTDLIIQQWDNLQRIFVSLAQKTTTQRILISKLSTTKRRSPMLLALWEYDHCWCSDYLLHYVDSPRLRSNVQRALNRGEQYHHLKRAVSHANAGRLRYASVEEQEIWNECSRLLVNAILYYNMVLLGEAIARREAAGDMAGAAQLAAVSPVAWAHINFYGRYVFTEVVQLIPILGLVAMIEQYPFRAQPTLEEALMN